MAGQREVGVRGGWQGQMHRSRDAAAARLATSRNVSVDRSGGTKDVRLDMSRDTEGLRGEAS